ncbi:chromosome partitioning protein [Pseudobutyrivibrio sp. 49]|uniref:ParA family protein n=1 Tax=Pseudobutyrivibrio sp. 49 TaxID=1855344 RepID=UPI00089043FA|nr:ParA family protein [Pseudobutyrivibrio sp. 49]SDI78941.1 chromosome partitioning protein [Pseudobutyrivibrio sp. 49]
MKVFAFITAKGGCGKSSLTLEAATVFGNMYGKDKVLVIDLDQQLSISKNCGADTEAPSILDVLQGDVPIMDAVQHNDLFDIIIASPKLARADNIFDRAEEDEYLLADVLDFAKDTYDYVFIDPAPSRNILQEMLYIAADYIVIPTRVDESSLDAVVTTENELNRLTNGRNKKSHAKLIGYVLNEYNKQTALGQMALETLEQSSEEKDNNPFIATVSSAIRVSEAKTLHTAVCRTEKSSKTGREIYAIVEQMLEKIGEDA